MLHVLKATFFPMFSLLIRAWTVNKPSSLFTVVLSRTSKEVAELLVGYPNSPLHPFLTNTSQIVFRATLCTTSLSAKVGHVTQLWPMSCKRVPGWSFWKAPHGALTQFAPFGPFLSPFLLPEMLTGAPWVISMQTCRWGWQLQDLCYNQLGQLVSLSEISG